MSARKPWSTSVTSEAFTRASVGRKPVLRALAVMALMPIAVLALGSLLPTYPLRILDFVLLYAILGMGLNIVVGYAGLLDLGYVAFYAIDAYTYALLASP